jgi:hypothetical protein
MALLWLCQGAIKVQVLGSGIVLEQYLNPIHLKMELSALVYAIEALLRLC